METIVAENVYKAYGEVQALNGVSLSVPKGQILGLLGPNGAGKTTLVRCLTTLLVPDSGTLTIGGYDVLTEKDKVRQIIGLSGQYSAVDEQLTGRENLIMVGRLYHLDPANVRNRADELLAQFSLEDAANRPVKTYSGGMRRRLDLAASVIADPPVLFLDEPTTGLDPYARKESWNFIRKLVTEGTTLLLTTQYLEEADYLADNIVLINKGEVAAEGTADELKANLASDVIEFRPEDRDQRQAALEAVSAFGHDDPQIDEETGLITVAVDEGSKSLMEVVRALDQKGIAIGDLSLRRPSLDDVFLSLTQQA
ncbi:MAG: ATP-binding cassette domain-containing protein [Chloroflexi bacterium]|nr:ATP-binding cassette domain-containing protein [Chloroflexota bacterium]